MIEKVKLSLWDFFVTIMVGSAILLNILIICVVNDLVTWKMIFGLAPSIIVLGGIITMTLAGLLFEPFANYLHKLLTICPRKYSDKLGFKK